MTMLLHELTISRCLRAAALLLVMLVSVLAIAPLSGHTSPVAAATKATSYTFTVNTTVDTHDIKPGDGVCADKKGKCSLRAAIEEADALPNGSSITITVPNGTYKLMLGTLQLKGHYTITINGAGKKTAIISGNHTFGIMSIGSPGISAHLSQLTIEGGSALGRNSGGGGIYNDGTLSVSHSTLSGNSATYVGGGIFNTGTLTITNSVLSSNVATDSNVPSYGGGIYNNAGKVTVTNSTLSNNVATGGDGVNNNSGSPGYGGGISNNGGTLSVTNSTLSNNAASGGYGGDFSGGNSYGGGIYNYAGRVTLINSILSGNAAIGGNGNSGGGNSNGGGIDNESGGTLNVSNSTLSSNSAIGGKSNSGFGGYGYGGGIDSNGGSLTVTNSTLSDNSAIGSYGGAGYGGSGYGGGIDNNTGGTLSVTNSTLNGNWATGGNDYYGGRSGYGGGIDNNIGGRVTMISSTLSGNSAYNGNGSAGYGGDIANEGNMVTLTGTIVANSPSGSNCSGTITEGVGYNLDSVTSCGFTLSTDLNNTDPKLGPLHHNGGPTKTMSLLQGSKAIDWVAATNCPATDQRGRPRPDNRENACDIGAYESSY